MHGKSVLAAMILSFSLLTMTGGTVLAQTARAKADLRNTAGESAGSVLFEEDAKGVRITVKIANLPAGMHSFHIHEAGRCDPPDFKSAGEHFNPDRTEHGFLNPKGPHAGDLPNIIVKADGTAETEFTTKRITLKEGDPRSLVRQGGTSVVLHEKPDDYLTDPSGGGGNRIACGPIEAIK
jgi:Cu-Zn family superoxide dismutase